VVVGGFAALALMTAVATAIVAAKTIEETAEAEPGPTLRGQMAVASPGRSTQQRRVLLSSTHLGWMRPSSSAHAEAITSSIHSNLLIVASSNSNPVPASASLADRGPGFPLAPIQLPKLRGVTKSPFD